MAVCPCGRADVEPDDHFCAVCGRDLRPGMEFTGIFSAVGPGGPASTSGSIPAVGSVSRTDLPTGSALLLVQRGSPAGTEFTLSADADVMTIGRSPDSDVFLDDVTVSRRHAELRRGAGGWSIRDAESLNGTYVNRARISDHQLRGGDELQIGKFRFVFLVGVA